MYVVVRLYKLPYYKISFRSSSNLRVDKKTICSCGSDRSDWTITIRMIVKISYIAAVSIKIYCRFQFSPLVGNNSVNSETVNDV